MKDEDKTSEQDTNLSQWLDKTKMGKVESSKCFYLFIYDNNYLLHLIHIIHFN